MLYDPIDDDAYTGDIVLATDSVTNHSSQPKLTEERAQNHEEFMRQQLFARHETEGGFEASFSCFKDRMTTVRKRSLFDDLQAVYCAYIDMLGEPLADAKIQSFYEVVFPGATIKSNSNSMLLMVKLVADNDRRKASLYAQGLRYALYKGIAPIQLESFLDENSGITGCARAYAKLLSPSDQQPATDAAKRPSPAKVKISLGEGVSKAIENLDFSESNEVQCMVTLQRNNDGNLLIKAVES